MVPRLQVAPGLVAYFNQLTPDTNLNGIFFVLYKASLLAIPPTITSTLVPRKEASTK